MRSLPTWTEAYVKHCELYLEQPPNKTSGEAILHYMGFLNMQQTYKLQAAQEYIRALTTESHPLYDGLQSHRDLAVRLKRVLPWTKAARDTLEEVVPVHNIKADPWVAYNEKPLLVDSVGDRTWREPDKAINNAEVTQYLESKEANTIIATDGSIRDNISAWGGAVWQNNRKHLNGVQESRAGPALSGQSLRLMKML